MSETTNGPHESKLDQTLDSFAAKCGLPEGCPLTVENEAKRLLTLEPGQLAALTRTQCAEGAFVLFQFAFFLQKASNREQSRVRWAEKTCKKIVASRLSQYKAYSFEERLLLATQDDDAASGVDVKGVNAQLKLDRLAYLSMKVEGLARSLETLRMEK